MAARRRATDDNQDPRESADRPERQEHASAIEDYAIVGDCHTAALIARDGSIDWLCWPRFDSPACFAALVGSPRNGRWRIAPAAPVLRTERRYRPGTMILETVFHTAAGIVAVTDFMAWGNGALIRIVEGRQGRCGLNTARPCHGSPG